MAIARKFYYFLSPSLRFLVRRVYYYPIDLYEGITRKRKDMIPPRGMIFIGSGDFETQGLHILDLLKKYAGLQPNAKVLDIGSGIGRLAVALTGYLDETGSYEGFDIVKKGVDWCRKKISVRFANFNFRHIDLKNDLYNLKTDMEAKKFEFPYPASEFDCVVLTSVFTHMMPDDVDNYLGQIARVMKKEGKCLATFFLIDGNTKEQMQKGNIRFDFKYAYEGYYLMDKKVKEANIAFDADYLASLLDKNELQADAVYRGSWSGNKEDSLDFQDVVIITKK